MSDGTKNDKGKPQYSLLPLQELEGVVRVLEFGVEIYERDDWKNVDNGHLRYLDATFRHLANHQSGHLRDDVPDAKGRCSGLLHIDHAIASLIMARHHFVKGLEEPAPVKIDLGGVAQAPPRLTNLPGWGHNVWAALIRTVIENKTEIRFKGTLYPKWLDHFIYALSNTLAVYRPVMSRGEWVITLHEIALRANAPMDDPETHKVIEAVTEYLIALEACNGSK